MKPHIENVHEKKRRWICKFYDEGGPRCGKDFSTIGNMKVGPIIICLPPSNSHTHPLSSLTHSLPTNKAPFPPFSTVHPTTARKTTR